MDPHRVYLVDDHDLIRRGLRSLLDADERFQVVGEAATAADARAEIPALRPDVAVLDVRLPDGSGIDVCRDVRLGTPEVNCLMLSAYDGDDVLFDAMLAGAAGFLRKSTLGPEMVEAIATVADGRSLLDPVLTGRVLQRLRGDVGADDRLAALTGQERRILELIGDGLTNRQIAEEVRLAEKTVKNYVSNLLAKMGMERRTQAAAYVARLSETRER